jgi:hypothetical protein
LPSFSSKITVVTASSSLSCPGVEGSRDGKLAIRLQIRRRAVARRGRLLSLLATIPLLTAFEFLDDGVQRVESRAQLLRSRTATVWLKFRCVWTSRRG